MSNIIKAVVGKNGKTIKTAPLYQYDYGQVLVIEGIELPQAYQVHFSNDPMGDSTTSIGSAAGVEIPDVYLASGETVYAWLFLHTGENDGETVLKIEIPVKQRAAITNETPTPQQQSEIDQIIEELNEAVDAAEDAQAAAETAAEQAEAQVEKYPVIVDGYWAFWDEEDQQYVKSNQKAQGPKGDTGDPGDPTELIDDATPDTDKTYSSSKIEAELTPVKNAIQGFEENCVEYILERVIAVGENLITNEATTSGTGWSGSVENGFTHSSGNTDPLVFAVETDANSEYIAEFDMTSNIEGGISAGIGDSPLADVYNGSEHAFVGFISDGGYLKLYPKSNYVGTVTNIKLRQVVETGTDLTQECKNIVNDKNIDDISGFWNTAIGPNAMQKNQNGTRNIAVGYCALWKMVSGNRNIAIGTYAASFITEGENNISIGADSLYNPARANLGGRAEGNVAIGKATLRSGEDTVDNVAIGGAAMSECGTNAKENVAIGVRAGFMTGNNNTFIGYRAGYYYTGDSTDNVAIGHDAGFSAYHNSKNCVFIGAEAKANVPGASSSTPKTCNNSIAIGKGAQVTGSYQIVIGNQFYETVKIAGKTIKFNQDGTVTWE